MSPLTDLPPNSGIRLDTLTNAMAKHGDGQARLMHRQPTIRASEINEFAHRADSAQQQHALCFEDKALQNQNSLSMDPSTEPNLTLDVGQLAAAEVCARIFPGCSPRAGATARSL